jgi:hypothetical protein
MTWNMLSDVMRTATSVNWTTISHWIVTHYLGNHWRVKEIARFKEMSFCQSSHCNETPYDYVLRRLFHCRMIRDLPENSPEELMTIMKDSPTEWLPLVPWLEAPGIETVLERLLQWNDHLVKLWEGRCPRGLSRRKDQRHGRCRARSSSSEENGAGFRTEAAEDVSVVDGGEEDGDEQGEANAMQTGSFRPSLPSRMTPRSFNSRMTDTKRDERPRTYTFPP